MAAACRAPARHVQDPAYRPTRPSPPIGPALRCDLRFQYDRSSGCPKQAAPIRLGVDVDSAAWHHQRSRRDQLDCDSFDCGSAVTPDRAAIVRALRLAGCVFAEDEADLIIATAENSRQLRDMVRRRASGIPLEQVIGWADFCGLRIAVAPGVFVPRRRTECLAREAAKLSFRGGTVVDLCCGSGAVGAAIAAAVAGVRLYAVDIDPAAVACARLNLSSAQAHVVEGDLFVPLPADLRGRVDTLVANVPYVPTDEVSMMPPEARIHEPRVALDGGRDGLDVLRRVARTAGSWLAPGGHVLVETSAVQAPSVEGELNRHGLVSRVARCDDVDGTIVIGSA